MPRSAWDPSSGPDHLTDLTNGPDLQAANSDVQINMGPIQWGRIVLRTSSTVQIKVDPSSGLDNHGAHPTVQDKQVKMMPLTRK